MGRRHQFFLIPVLAVFIVMAMISPCQASTDNVTDPLASAMAEYLECYSVDLVSFKDQQPSSVPRNLCLLDIYQKNGRSSLWVSSRGPSKSAVEILETLKNSDTEGLSPTDYGVNEMMALWGSLAPDKLAQLDTLITINLIKYVHDISRGQIKLRDIDSLLFAEAGDADFDPLATVDKVLAAKNLSVFFAELPPSHSHYTDLKKSLKIYHELAQRGGWNQIPQGEFIRPGDRGDRVTAVVKRLDVTGDLMVSVTDDSLYVYSLMPSLKQFQTRHGLNADGVVGPETLAAMNISADEAVRKIMINMARWRWQAHSLGEKYILVNIASFNLSGFDHGEMKLNFPVIVGKQQNQTPVFSDRVQYVTFNPFWNIPPSIAQDEELLGLRNDPLHLVKRHIRLFPSWKADAIEMDSTTMDWATISKSQISLFKLRQDPGPWNALGDVKFIFPNKYEVYMHATSNSQLFQRKQRDFSHGCIRVSDPLGLAKFILSHGGISWDRAEIEEIIQQGETKVVVAETPVPVHITYQTTWVGGDGLVYFSSDLYDRDKKLGQALFSADVVN
ncbi:MAG: L,D-transpeptidase family protein [Deltaproteobacteria bacterium]|nr:L,D-transpeptidase family protein [Deltaproteobacteria bacterium]